MLKNEKGGLAKIFVVVFFVCFVGVVINKYVIPTADASREVDYKIQQNVITTNERFTVK